MSEELENLEQSLLESPAARARFLADTLEVLERNGVDTTSPEFVQQMGGALDVSEASRFVGGLAASTIVIAIASAGQRGAQGGQIGNAANVIAVASTIGGKGAPSGKIGQAASTIVIAIASAGQRGAGNFGKIGQAASTIVIAIASAGQRGAGNLGKIGQAASTIVIAIASAGQRGAGNLGKIGQAASTIGGKGAPSGKIGQAASTIVIAIASAGQRGAGNLGKIGQAASTIVIAIASAGGRSAGQLGRGFEADPEGITITVPATATLVEVAQALQQLAETLIGEGAALEQEMAKAREALEGPGGQS